MSCLLTGHLDYPNFTNLGGPIAVVDIGSNSVRLVVFDRVSRTPATLFNEKVTCGLGRSLRKTGKLDPDGLELAIPNMRRFSKLAQSMGVKWTVYLATAAVRDADDGPDFVEEINELCGGPVTVLSGAQEAQLSALGVVAAFPEATGLIGDLGGGSLELVEVNQGRLGRFVTLPLGTLYLKSLGAPSSGKVRREIDRQLSSVEWLREVAGNRFYAVGGSWRNLALLALETESYPLHIVNGYQIRTEALRSLSQLLSVQTVRSLKEIRAVSKRRLEELPYGALLMDRVLAAAGCRSITFTAQGLREGFIYDCLSMEKQAADPLILAANDIEVREGRLAFMGDELFEWTAALFPDESRAQARLRQVACLLADIGWREHVDYRGTMTFWRVLQHPFLAIDHPGRVFLAYALLVRYGASEKDERIAAQLRLLSPSQVGRARILGQALRLAFRVSGAVGDNLRRSALEITGDSVELKLPKDGSLPDGKAVQQGVNGLKKAISQAQSGYPMLAPE